MWSATSVTIHSVLPLAVELLENIHAVLAEHDDTCPTAKALLLNPGNHGFLGWDVVYGLPILPDPRVAPKRVRVLCGVGWGGIFAGRPVIWDEAGNSFHPRGELIQSLKSA